jgi:hypothetical protein
MGFDKPDLGLRRAPRRAASPIAYYQQVGRAGRGVERADVVLLPGARTATSGLLRLARLPAEEQVRQTLDVLADEGPAAVDGRARAVVELSPHPAGDDAQGARRRRRGAPGRGGWEATGQPWAYDAERYERVSEASASASSRRCSTTSTPTGCRMEFLRRQLDDPEAGRLRAVRQLLSPQAPDEPVPDDVAKAVVGVLADWAKGPGGWASGSPDAQPRPVGVVTMASHGRPRLIQSLGARIAEVGRLPLLGSIEYAPGHEAAQVSRSNSAQRLKALDGALVVPPGLATTLAQAQGPVLLVDDSTETGWTLAVAARLLRRSGAQGVLPLVLAVQA